ALADDGRQLVVQLAREDQHLPRGLLRRFLVGRHVVAAAAPFLHVAVVALHAQRLRERLHRLQELLARDILRKNLEVRRHRRSARAPAGGAPRRRGRFGGRPAGGGGEGGRGRPRQQLPSPTPCPA